MLLDPKIDPRRAKCRTEYASQAYLWDAELDGNVKHGVAETAEQRAVRHAEAKEICNTCSQSMICRWIGMNDPLARGIWGGELVS